MSNWAEDRIALMDVMLRYAAGVDERDMVMYRSCLHDDVEVHGFGADGVVYRGGDVWTDYVVNALKYGGNPPELRLGHDLMANEQRLAGEIMSKARTYYGCKGTVSKCLGARGKASRNAWRLARYIVFLVGKGLSEKEVLKVVSLRRKSAKPKKRKRIKVAGTPYLGPLNAPVQIVEYADFRCGHCAAVAPMLKQLLAKYKGKVVLFFKPYPLRQGAAVRAAQASLAAHLQGKFWPMHKRLFDNPSMHDAAGLNWGAIEQGDQSGDTMHFDGRNIRKAAQIREARNKAAAG